jgi:myo-inositol-1(or 4)-monophosphatase
VRFPNTQFSIPDIMSDFTSFALSLAHTAGQRLLDFYEQELTIVSKSTAFDLVTQADQESEKLVIGRIRDTYPDHAILAEESGASAETSRYCWVIDPLDGTTNFALSLPQFSVTIALQIDGQTEIGVVYDPLREETFLAERGAGAWLMSPRVGKRRLQVRSTATLEDSLLCTGFPYSRVESKTNNLTEFNRVALRVRGIRRLGSAALDLAYVACGRLDGYWEYDLKPWDSVAGVLLVEEAEGQVSQLSGEAWHSRTASTVAANPLLLPVMLAALNGEDG